MTYAEGFRFFSCLKLTIVALVHIFMCCRLPSLVGVGTQIPAGPAAMQLVHVDLFVVEEAVFHVASKGRQAAVLMACFQLRLRLGYDS